MHAERGSLRSWLLWPGAVTLFLSLAVAHTWPLARVAATHVYAGADTVSGVWSLFGLARQLTRDPSRPLDGDNLYPYGDTLAVLDHQLGSAPLAVPLVAAGADSPLAYNVVLIAGFALSGLFTCALVRSLTGSMVAGLVAGCAFAFAGYRSQALHHPHLLITHWLPLALLMLHRFLDRPSVRRWLALAATASLVALSSWHVAVLGAATIAVLALVMLARYRRDLVLRLAGVALAGLVSAAAVAPLALTYQAVGERWPPQTGEGRETIGTLVAHSADLSGALAMPPASRTPYAGLLAASTGTRPGFFPGMVVLALAIVALWTRRPGSPPPGRVERVTRWALWLAMSLAGLAVLAALGGERTEPLLAVVRPLAPFALLGVAALAHGLAASHAAGERGERGAVIAYGALAAVGALMALGPVVTLREVDLGSGLNRLDLLPVRLIMRAPARFALLTALGTAVLAGLGTARLLRGRALPRRIATAAALLVLLNLDLGFSAPGLSAVATPTDADRWLAGSTEPGAVIEYPLVQHYWSIVASQRYGRQTVNGAGYLAPPPLRQLESHPDFSDEQLDLLWTHLHPRFVVVRTALYPPPARAAVLAALEAQRPALRPRLRQGDDLVYELEDRGHGPAIQRVWPRRRLEESAGALEFEGRVTSGRPGTIGELVVELNGRTLLVEQGPQLEERGTYVAEFGAAALVDGLNVFELRAEYHWDAAAAPHAIAGGFLAADVNVIAESHQTLVQVNGRQLVAGPGYQVVVLEPSSGDIVAHEVFAFLWDRHAPEALERFVAAVPVGSMVIVAGYLDPSSPAMATVTRTLPELGVEEAGSGAIAALGIKGGSPGTAMQVRDASTATLTLGDPERRRVQLWSLRLR